MKTRLLILLCLVVSLLRLGTDSAAYGADPNVYYGGVQIANVNAVASFGADNTGGTDACPKIQNGLTALAGHSAQALWLPAGTYACATPVLVPNNVTIRLSAQASIVSSLPVVDGHTSTPFYADGAPYSHVTTLASTPTVGSETLTLTSATGYAIGQYIFVTTSTSTYFASYKIVNLVTTTVTVDRPILKPFVGGDTVEIMTRQPAGISILADKGATLSGTGDRGIQLVSCVDCVVRGLTINSSFTSYAASFDGGGQRVLWDGVNVNCVANCAVGLALEEAEYGTVRDVNALGGFTVANVQINSCESAMVDNTNGLYGVGPGLELVNSVSEPIGNRNTTVLGGHYNGNNDGINGSTVNQNTTLVGVTTTGNGSAGVRTGTGQGWRIVGHHSGGNASYGIAATAALSVQGLDMQGQVTGIDGSAVLLDSGTGNVTLSGWAIDAGTSLTGGFWQAIQHTSSGRLTITGSTFVGSSSAHQTLAIRVDAGSAVIDATKIAMTGADGYGLFANGGTIQIGPSVDYASSNTPSDAAAGGFPFNFGTFTANGTSEVATSGTFDVGATVLMSLKSTGTTPCAGLPPYFDKTQIANTFYTKAGTASCNDVYNWVAYGQVH